jgi:hypothetical protein
VNKTVAQAAAFALATLVTAATFFGANAIARREYVKSDAVAMSHMQMLAAQTVVIVDRHA